MVRSQLVKFISLIKSMTSIDFGLILIIILSGGFIGVLFYIFHLVFSEEDEKPNRSREPSGNQDDEQFGPDDSNPTSLQKRIRVDHR